MKRMPRTPRASHNHGKTTLNKRCSLRTRISFSADREAEISATVPLSVVRAKRWRNYRCHTLTRVVYTRSCLSVPSWHFLSDTSSCDCTFYHVQFSSFARSLSSSLCLAHMRDVTMCSFFSALSARARLDQKKKQPQIQIKMDDHSPWRNFFFALPLVCRELVSSAINLVLSYVKKTYVALTWWAQKWLASYMNQRTRDGRSLPRANVAMCQKMRLRSSNKRTNVTRAKEMKSERSCQSAVSFLFSDHNDFSLLQRAQKTDAVGLFFLAFFSSPPVFFLLLYVLLPFSLSLDRYPTTGTRTLEHSFSSPSPFFFFFSSPSNSDNHYS